MRLTDYTDYTLRVLMFCALNPERSVTIAELAESHAVSKNHLMKIVNHSWARRWPAAAQARCRHLHRRRGAPDRDGFQDGRVL
jgi:Iron-dependent Transcriptional regulator